MSGSSGSGSGPHVVAREAFRFGIVYVLLESLNVAFVSRQMGLLFTDLTFSPTT